MRKIFLTLFLLASGSVHAADFKSLCKSLRLHAKSLVEMTSGSINDSNFVNRKRAQHVSFAVFQKGTILNRTQTEKTKDNWSKESCILSLGEDESGTLQAGYYSLEVDGCEEPVEKNTNDPHMIRLIFKGKRGGDAMLICRSNAPLSIQSIQFILGSQFAVSD